MIEFKPVRLEDKQTIERYTMPSGIYNCDLAFANMYCWQAMYHSAWAVIDGFLVIRFQIGGGEKIGYMQPVGEGDFARIIPALREDAHAHGQRLRIIGLTDEGREMVRNMHAGLFAFESDRGMEDYVYNADDLRNLTGRKYQPKRNHINRFMAEYPGFRYEQLTRERFGECMQLEREWRRAHEGHTSELCAEQRAMQRAFEHFEELEMLGGCIYVGDRLIAFTYGSAVNDHTFDTHVEKADTDYDGAFTIINKLFAQHLPARFTMINREEDLGIDGLRQSKLSYHPAVIQHKYAAIHLHPDEIACKELWTAAFGDDEQFVDSFLMRYYSRRRMLTAECEGRTAAMLHMLPFESELGRSTYIYGVATAPEFRRRGLAGKLIREAMRLIGKTASISGRATPRKTGPWSGGEPPGLRCPRHCTALTPRGSTALLRRNARCDIAPTTRKPQTLQSAAFRFAYRHLKSSVYGSAVHFGRSPGNLLHRRDDSLLADDRQRNFVFHASQQRRDGISRNACCEFFAVDRAGHGKGRLSGHRHDKRLFAGGQGKRPRRRAGRIHRAGYHIERAGRIDSTGNLHLSKIGSTRVSIAGRCQEREFGIGVLHLDGNSSRIGSIDRLGLVDQILCGRILLRRQRIFGTTGRSSHRQSRRRPCHQRTARAIHQDGIAIDSPCIGIKFHQFRCSSNAGNKNIEIGCIRFRLGTRNDIECRHTYELYRRDFRLGGGNFVLFIARTENGRSHGCSSCRIVKKFHLDSLLNCYTFFGRPATRSNEFNRQPQLSSLTERNYSHYTKLFTLHHTISFINDIQS